MHDSLLAKAVDIGIDLFLKFLIFILKVLSPIKVSPKEVRGKESNAWKEISSIDIQNRLNSNLYDIWIAGISKQPFSLTIISDSEAKSGKTIEHMNINTNRLVVWATDRRNGNHLWLFRIHKLSPKETVNLNVKIENTQAIYFKVLRYSRIEVPIRERDDGVVEIPFKIEEVSDF